ncbi:hypothetical protein BJY18_001670 [Amycolatopsis jiangsuensis]|uniref:Uncharacterized protein n=1 Tax=Amycolatopsis jiangsuensis TaxID=1181879 RepID=A0A840IRW8_9PSEU|nr:hypothetical protein [Amycolatopsis jiangsuensis]
MSLQVARLETTPDLRVVVRTGVRRPEAVSPLDAAMSSSL